MSRLTVPLALAVVALTALPGWGEPYNPYAAFEEPPPPVAADGTIQWGVFYKSARIQQAYERLWHLGACRGSNKAITVPVAENKLVIDRLPEADFQGVVRSAAGGLAGGLVAFAGAATAGEDDKVLIAQLHPAGVSRLSVRGVVPAEALAVGTIVRLKVTVDAKGRGTEPVTMLEIVTPPAEFVPDAIRPGHEEPLVGSVVSLRHDTLILRVDAGTIRRLTLRVAADAVVQVDGARLDLVSAGDHVEIRGRLWAGDGGLADGTVFASDMIVTKHQAAPAPGPRTVGAR